MVGETNKLLRSKLPKLLESMKLYLANKETESILFKPIKVGIQEAYRDFRRILDQHYRGKAKCASAKSLPAHPDSSATEVEDDDDEDIRIIACPEAEELNLLLTSIIAGLAEEKKETTPPSENTPETVSATPPSSSEMNDGAVGVTS